jgi:hypothetical protein
VQFTRPSYRGPRPCLSGIHDIRDIKGTLVRLAAHGLYGLLTASIFDGAALAILVVDFHRRPVLGFRKVLRVLDGIVAVIERCQWPVEAFLRYLPLAGASGRYAEHRRSFLIESHIISPPLKNAVFDAPPVRQRAAAALGQNL